MLLIQFLGLQIADAVTTLVFLQHGVNEANPLIRVALALFGQPALGLVIAKALGIGVALVAWRTGRRGMLRKNQPAICRLRCLEPVGDCS